MSWLVRLTNVILFLAVCRSAQEKEKFYENHCNINTIHFSLVSNFAWNKHCLLASVWSCESVRLMSGQCFGSSRQSGASCSRGPYFCSLVVTHTQMETLWTLTEVTLNCKSKTSRLLKDYNGNFFLKPYDLVHH